MARTRKVAAPVEPTLPQAAAAEIARREANACFPKKDPRRTPAPEDFLTQMFVTGLGGEKLAELAGALAPTPAPVLVAIPAPAPAPRRRRGTPTPAPVVIPTPEPVVARTPIQIAGTAVFNAVKASSGISAAMSAQAAFYRGLA